MHEEDKKVRGLSQVAVYTITAVVLGLITAWEVLVLYPPLAATGETFRVALLGVLACTKFVLVVALFMHLWNDNPLFTGIFGLGLVIGGGTLVGLLALFSYYPKPENAIKAPPLEEIYKKRYEGADYNPEHSFLYPPSVPVDQA